MPDASVSSKSSRSKVRVTERTMAPYENCRHEDEFQLPLLLYPKPSYPKLNRTSSFFPYHPEYIGQVDQPPGDGMDVQLGPISEQPQTHKRQYQF